MIDVKPPIQKRTIIGWRQLDRRKAEIRSKRQSTLALTTKRTP